MTEPDNVYVNLSFYCKKNNITDPDVPAVFYSNRNTPILKDAGKYEMSIARFDIESQNIPILIPSIQTGQGDINLTNYCVQIKQVGGAASQPIYLEYACKNKYTYNAPSVAGADSPYYYIYNIQHVVDMFNVACASAVSIFDNLAAPFMKYNNDNTFSIYFDSQFESDYAFCVNDALYNLFRNFNYTYELNDGINNIIIVQNVLGLNRTIILLTM
jgi:hypothetical protein